MIMPLRIKSFPFQDGVADFINHHEKTFVIEQNRDGQMRSLIINECGINPDRLVPITNIDSMPVTAGHIIQAMEQTIDSSKAPATKPDRGEER